MGYTDFLQCNYIRSKVITDKIGNLVQLLLGAKSKRSITMAAIRAPAVSPQVFNIPGRNSELISGNSCTDDQCEKSKK
ncbi:MAG: hypothetical protein B6D76_15690 [gamma proteobacterium symbiont of Stewartia floridana]|nr:MAG: hypothetical protein B6D76_15690 [gamma proteobacterium symbiont of Stewartia floridana]RLW60770.1 MAG: hypothetical protein B6D75_04680 [gamma proteobacterium symbiont of Stewartia floridana]